MLSQNPHAMQQNTGVVKQEQNLRAQLELLQSHDTTPAAASAAAPRDPKSAPSPPPPSRSSNGYDVLAASASHDAARALATKPEVEAHIHPDLRAHPGQDPPTLAMMSLAPAPGQSPAPVQLSPIHASLAPAPPSSLPEPDSGDGRKAKRELSQSKRAAQNRAAQRAFRQRKEGYIKKLEQQVREYNELEQSFKAMQTENYALREYIIHLQSRLLDIQGEYPQPPPNVNLSHTSASHPQSAGPPEPAVATPGAGTPLEAVAQAVAGLAAQEQMEDQHAYASENEEDTRTAEEINRQLQPEDEAPTPT